MSPPPSRPNVTVDIEQIGGMRKADTELMIRDKIEGHYKDVVEKRFNTQDDNIAELDTKMDKVEKTLFKFVGDETSDGDFQRFCQMVKGFIERQDAAAVESSEERKLITARMTKQEASTSILEKRMKSSDRTLKLIAAIQLSGHTLWKIVIPILTVVYAFIKIANYIGWHPFGLGK